MHVNSDTAYSKCYIEVLKNFKIPFCLFFCALSNGGISFLKKQNIQGDKCKKRIFTSKIKEKHNFQ